MSYEDKELRNYTFLRLVNKCVIIFKQWNWSISMLESDTTESLSIISSFFGFLFFPKKVLSTSEIYVRPQDA